MQKSRLVTFSQVQQQLIQAKQQFSKALNNNPLQPFDMVQIIKDIVTPTIQEVIENILSEQNLLQKMKQIKSVQHKRQSILNYSANYDVINQFKNNIESTKQQAVNTYYLLSLLNPVNLKKIEQQQASNNSLESWKIKTNEPTKKKGQDNMLREDYRQYIKSHESNYGKNNLGQNDLIFHVIFYDSCNKEKQNQFICHNSLMLSQLRDRFYCLIEELEEKNPKNGSFFFINQTFYNDSRYGRQNISCDIVNTARLNKVEYQTYSMQKTSLKNIRAQISKPYVWRHLKGCDHMIVFSQYRLFDPLRDILLKSEYPINIYQKKIGRKRCQGCNKYYAKIVAQTDRNKNGQDLYLCLQCHEHIHLQQVPKSEAKLPKYQNLIVSRYLHQ